MTKQTKSRENEYKGHPEFDSRSSTLAVIVTKQHARG